MLLICLFFTLVMEIHGISLTEMRYDVAWLLTLHYHFPVCYRVQAYLTFASVLFQIRVTVCRDF